MRPQRGMSAGPTADAISHFLRDIARPGTVYFLGAGASAGLVPMVAEATPKLLPASLNRGLYPTTPNLRMAFREAIGLDSLAENLSSSDRCRYVLTPEAALKAEFDAVLLAANPWSGARPHPAYQFFSLVAPGAAVVTTNNDSLIRRFAPHLPMFELHGSLFDIESDGDEGPTRWPFRGIDYLSWLYRKQAEWAHEFDRRIGPTPVTVRPSEPVPKRLLPRWELALPRLASASCLVMIGYSLPDYDELVIELLRDTSRDRELPIWIVNPYPDEIAGRLAELLRSRRVAALSVRWNIFSTALDRVAHRRAARNVTQIEMHAAEIVLEYLIAEAGDLLPRNGTDRPAVHRN